MKHYTQNLIDGRHIFRYEVSLIHNANCRILDLMQKIERLELEIVNEEKEIATLNQSIDFEVKQRYTFEEIETAKLCEE